ncbi:sulfatase-like hydrolase/transferase [Compostibacter hankyongensis]|uniref:Sulfatase n=1 Tax=Compostibacter hankyongensis TaxID=1007089 RepID=A0ABP8FHN0_9BACT
MKRITWFLLLPFCGILLTLKPLSAQRAATHSGHPPPPNILWIVSEDNSAEYVGCYGNKMATTPNLDKLASEGVLYENAFASAPVCAPTRSTLIAGVYATAMGTQHMRSTYPIPDFIRFFPYYLQQSGYYCTNQAKKDYNTVDQPGAWNESSKKAIYRNRRPGQPFFAVINLGTTHESSIHNSIPAAQLKHDPEKMPIPAYLPHTPEVKHDLAQYYDKMQQMDAQVGKILDRLEKDGLAGNTIVFYYGDNGGVLPRSKRFVYESGLRIPLIIRFPEQYRYLSPANPGTATDRMVSFVDFAPTVLSLAGIKIPPYMQGKAFLGSEKQPPAVYAYGFRGRMDETYDMSRTVRDSRYRYIRNYMPDRIYGQHIAYLWEAPSMQSWEKAYKEGRCDQIQSAFWQSKPPEELYDIRNDPDNVHNLAGDPKYKAVLISMRKANAAWIRHIHDAGFMPEAMMAERAEHAGTTIYQYVRSRAYPQEKILSMAEIASMGAPRDLEKLMEGLKDADPAVRYWAAYGCVLLKRKALPARQQLSALLDDPYPDVAIAAAEACYNLGDTTRSINRLLKALDHDNDKVRLHALNVLRVMGRGALPALPKLRALQQSPRIVKGETYGQRTIDYIISNL